MLGPEDIAAAVDGSLRRLRLDVIDLYYQHRVNPGVPIEDMVGAANLITPEGRKTNMSEAAPDMIRRAHAVQPVTAIQSEYNLVVAPPRASVLAACAELGTVHPIQPTRQRLPDRNRGHPRPPSPLTTCGRRSRGSPERP